MSIVLVAMVVALMFIGFFAAGAVTAWHLLDSAERRANRSAGMEFYTLAGYRTPADPKPYVPPRLRTQPPRRIIPHIDEIGRRIKAGGRATVLMRGNNKTERPPQPLR